MTDTTPSTYARVYVPNGTMFPAITNYGGTMTTENNKRVYTFSNGRIIISPVNAYAQRAIKPATVSGGGSTKTKTFLVRG